MKLKGVGPNLIIFLAFILVFVGLWSGDIKVTALLTGMLTLFATATGAVLAFRFQEMRESQLTIERNRVAMSKAFFVLARQCSACYDLEKFLPPGQDPVIRAFTTRGMNIPEREDLRQDYSELAFLLDGYGDELYRLTSIDETFHQMIATVNRRSTLFSATIMPALLKATGGEAGTLTPPEIRTALGASDYDGCIEMTTEMYNSVYSLSEKITTMADDLRVPSRALFPGVKFIGFSKKVETSPSQSAGTGE
jgi:hypothetical protein